MFSNLEFGMVKIVEGSKVNVKIFGIGVKVDDVKVIKVDVFVSNGVIYVIDIVIILFNN